MEQAQLGYRSGDHPVAWEGLLHSLEQSLPCHSSCVILRWPRPTEFGVVVSPSPDAASALEFQSRSFARDPFYELQDGRVRVVRDMCDDASLERHPYYRDFMGPHHIRDILSLDLVDEESRNPFRFRFVRAEGEPLFSKYEKHALELMIPSLRMAARLYAQAAHQDVQLAAYGAATAHVNMASFVLDTGGAILAKNPLAQRIIQKKDGFTISNGRLRATDPAGDRRLQRALEQLSRYGLDAGRKAPDPILLPRATGRWNLLFRTIKTAAILDTLPTTSLVVLAVEHPRSPRLSERLLRDVFDLTPREASLARCMAEGLKLDDAAATLSMSLGTARVHLRSIFSKMDVNTQSQLVCAVLNTASSPWD